MSPSRESWRPVPGDRPTRSPFARRKQQGRDEGKKGPPFPSFDAEGRPRSPVWQAVSKRRPTAASGSAATRLDEAVHPAHFWATGWPTAPAVPGAGVTHAPDASGKLPTSLTRSPLCSLAPQAHRTTSVRRRSSSWCVRPHLRPEGRCSVAQEDTPRARVLPGSRAPRDEGCEGDVLAPCDRAAPRREARAWSEAARSPRARSHGERLRAEQTGALAAAGKAPGACCRKAAVARVPTARFLVERAGWRPRARRAPE